MPGHLFKVKGDVLWLVCICADGDDLAAKFAVAGDDLLGGIRMTEPVFKTAGIDLDALAAGNGAGAESHR